MPPILQLEEFVVSRLLVEWTGEPDGEEDRPESDQEIDYEVLRHPEDENLMALKLSYSSRPKNSGYSINCEVFGTFIFAPDVSEEDRQGAIRFNGSTILYGLMRGQLVAATGAFPAGTFLMPTVSMAELVPKIEARKANKKAKQTAR